MAETSIRRAIVLGIVLSGAPNLVHASLGATANVTASAVSSTMFHDEVVLTNMGTTTVGKFWFAWVPGENFLPDMPSNVHTPPSWSFNITHGGGSDGYAIQWLAGPGGLLPAGQSLSGFSFDSDVTPSQLASFSTFYPTTAAETSFVYSGAPFSDSGFQFLPVNALQFVSVPPCRIMDTRDSTFSGFFGPPFISGGTSRSIPVPSSTKCNIPSAALAYSFNVTAIPRTGSLAYLTIWPAGQPQAVVSTLNSPDGSILANAAIVPAGTEGAINAFVTNDIDLVIDINGYFVPLATNTLQFYPMTPCRLLDTRNASGTFGGPAITGGTAAASRSLRAHAACRRRRRPIR